MRCIHGLCTGLYDLGKDMGSIRLDGRAIDSLDKVWLRKKIGFINQSPTLFKTTIYKNLIYGLDDGDPKADLENVKKAAAQANAHTFIMALPSGTNYLLLPIDS